MDKMFSMTVEMDSGKQHRFFSTDEMSLRAIGRDLVQTFERYRWAELFDSDTRMLARFDLANGGRWNDRQQAA